MDPTEQVEPVLGQTNIHLDFHTPQFQREVGRDWDPERFASTLAEANVDSVTFFAKGCHGSTYYDSAVGPNHPNLDRDLLAEAIDACHRRDIGVLAYYTLAWDNLPGEENPDWYQRDGEGNTLNAETRTDRWEYLCLNSPYTEEVVYPHVRELLEYDIDGFWFDILLYHEDACTCRYCVKSMRTTGLDPDDPEDRLTHRARVCQNFAKRTTELVKSHDDDLVVTYNHRLGVGLTQDLHETMDYLVIESLPVGWGYMHTPMYARYTRNFDRPVQGMTGVFHKVWGDFGTVKHTTQLKYELSASLSHHLPVSVGDQLRPRGELEAPKYDAIGEAFEYAKRRELPPAEPIRDVAIVLPGHHDPAGRDDSMNPDHPEMGAYGGIGATKYLVDAHYQFDILDQTFASEMIDEFSVAILPDTGPLESAACEAIDQFVRDGGRLLATGTSSLDADEFGLAEAFGVTHQGTLPYSTGYLYPGEYIEGLPDIECVSYGPFQSIQTTSATEQAAVVAPTTERSETRRFSHYQAPPERVLDVPAITHNTHGNGEVTYIGTNLFTQYYREDYHGHRTLLTNILESLHADQRLAADAPASIEVNAMQTDDAVYVHATNYHTSRGGESLPQISDIVPATDVQVHLRHPDVDSGTAITDVDATIESVSDGVEINFDAVRIHEIVKLPR